MASAATSARIIIKVFHVLQYMEDWKDALNDLRNSALKDALEATENFPMLFKGL